MEWEPFVDEGILVPRPTMPSRLDAPPDRGVGRRDPRP